MNEIAHYADWLAHGRLAPFVVGRRSGGNAVSIFQSRQPAGDMSDPATPTFCVAQNLGGAIRHRSDLGNGMRSQVDPPGAIFLFRPNFATSINVHVPHEIRTFVWSASWVEQMLADQDDALLTGMYEQGVGIAYQSEKVHGLLNRLWVDSAEENMTSQLSAEGLSLYILAEVLRMTSQPAPLVRGGLAPWATRRCIDYIEAHLDREVPIAELAALVGLSGFHFCRAFKASTGHAPGAFQRGRRMARAKSLLLDSELPIIDVAACVGYETPQAFARIFRRSTGITPSHWRRTARR